MVRGARPAAGRKGTLAAASSGRSSDVAGLEVAGARLGSGGSDVPPARSSQGFRRTSPERFLAALRRNPRGSYISQYGLEEYISQYGPEELAEKWLYLSPDEETGFALEEGDLQNVFHNPGGSVSSAKAVEAGSFEGAATFDSYDGFLPEHKMILEECWGARLRSLPLPAARPEAPLIHPHHLSVAFPAL